jgi:iron complex outermembrane receptor protein
VVPFSRRSRPPSPPRKRPRWRSARHAQKREQRLQDVPTTVNVLSDENLRAAQVTEVNQLSTLNPGIFINSDQTGRNSKIKVRGVGPDEQSNIRPAVGFFYNDIPIMNQLQGGLSVASDLDLGDLERIEVLKGPQSTLFGESVSGGAIAFYNRRPKVGEDLNGRAAVTFGDHELQQIRGSLGGALGDKFAFRIAAHHNEMRDQVLNTVDNSRRKLEGEGYSAQLLFEPTEYLSFILEYNYRRTSQQGGANDGMDASLTAADHRRRRGGRESR